MGVYVSVLCFFIVFPLHFNLLPFHVWVCIRHANQITQKFPKKKKKYMCVCKVIQTYELLKAANLYHTVTHKKRRKFFNQDCVPLILIAKKFIYAIVCNLNNSWNVSTRAHPRHANDEFRVCSSSLLLHFAIGIGTRAGEIIIIAVVFVCVHASGDRWIFGWHCSRFIVCRFLRVTFTSSIIAISKKEKNENNHWYIDQSLCHAIEW